ncbi:FecR family protein [Pedobacter frigiditerrae]|uniref:FecR family protein n=1 Tax=Pedobacter frigiditerrae TaxID=2530452 RepID=A0A4R0MQ51_9SPHI|nr:FecR family protein [Pedobacter frigiditerrae]TCC88687.1 FecR family protein [Pedobacter frigiditerrae]
MNTEKRFSVLLNRYVEGNISLEDHDELFEMISSGKYEHLICAQMDICSDGADESLITIAECDSQNIMRNILSIAKEQEKVAVARQGTMRFFNKWFIAASVLIIAGAGWIFYDRILNRNSFINDFKALSSEKIKNTSQKLQTVLLPDGSEIALNPGSCLYYSKARFSEKREVYLEGQANFQVTKNPNRPFYVFYDKVVTKVLGTSFKVHTNRKSGNVEVDVLTGQVQVYENNQLVKTEQRDVKLIITPNQKAIYDTKKRYFKATLVANPIPLQYDSRNRIRSKLIKQRYNFTVPTRLSQILKSIEADYGVEIIVDNEELYESAFVGDVSMSELFEKLKIICLATNSQYEVNGTKILLKSNNNNI